MAQGLTKKDMQDVVGSSIDAHTVKLFKYLGEEFGKIDQRFEETDQKIDKLQSSISNLAADLKTYHGRALSPWP